MLRIEERACGVLLAGLVASCHGQVGPSAGVGGGTTPEASAPGVVPPNVAAPGRAADVGPMPLRRLTRVELNHSLRDLLGDTTNAADTLAADQDVSGSGFASGGSISTVDVDQLLRVTEQVTTSAVARLPQLLPCGGALPTGAAAERACAEAFVARFGRRAYRRPPTAEETEGLLSIYTKARDERAADFTGAMRVVMQAMLLSPAFQFRWELGPQAARAAGDVVALTGWEVASRLSFLLWASTPDDELLDAAAAGQLATADQIERQARRLLAHPRATDMLVDFHTQWLSTSGLLRAQKDPRRHPDYTPELALSMQAETRAFVHHVWSGDGKLGTLLTAPHSFVDARLAKVYGASATGTELRRTALPPERAGLLTQGAFLTVHAKPGESHPIKRGKEVAERLLCVELPVPPANVPEPREPAAELSTRERFAEHGRNECAVACHSILDPLGFAFEHFDAVGAHRTTDGGKPVDATGTITIDGKPLAFAKARDLVEGLAGSETVQACLVKQWLRYAGKRKELPGEATPVTAAFVDTKLDLRELLVATVRSRAFSFRKPAAGEVLQ